jgi:hypothetical protein
MAVRCYHRREPRSQRGEGAAMCSSLLMSVNDGKCDKSSSPSYSSEWGGDSPDFWGGTNVPRPGVKELQVPFALLKPSATIKVGGTAD